MVLEPPDNEGEGTAGNGEGDDEPRPADGREAPRNEKQNVQEDDGDANKNGYSGLLVVSTGAVDEERRGKNNLGATTGECENIVEREYPCGFVSWYAPWGRRTRDGREECWPK
jgi:hypothetical protein